MWKPYKNDYFPNCLGNNGKQNQNSNQKRKREKNKEKPIYCEKKWSVQSVSEMTAVKPMFKNTKEKMLIMSRQANNLSK